MEDATAAGDRSVPQHPWWHHAAWGTALLLALGYGAWHLWDSRQQAQARERAETQVVAIVRGSSSSYLQTATDQQIVSDAYGSCPAPGAETGQWTIVGGSEDPDEDPAKTRSDSTVLPLHEPSANLLAWRALVADAAEQAELCQLKETG